MQMLYELDSLDCFIELYEIGQPNDNHRLIASLAQLGYVKIVMTPNFDQHIEGAFIESGL